MIVVTVPPLVFGRRRAGEAAMGRVCKKFAKAAGRQWVHVDTPAGLGVNAIPDGAQDLLDAINALDPESEIVVIGYSQGAQVISHLLNEQGAGRMLGGTHRPEFVLLGNPARPVEVGGTPDLKHRAGGPLERNGEIYPRQLKVMDIARQGDWFADRTRGRVVGSMAHNLGYWTLDLDAILEHTMAGTYGTTYCTVGKGKSGPSYDWSWLP